MCLDVKGKWCAIRPQPSSSASISCNFIDIKSVPEGEKGNWPDAIELMVSR